MSVNPQSLPATSSNQSTEKAFAILEHLIEQPDRTRLVDISVALHINPSTASRFLTALETCGYVTQNADNLQYKPTYKICRLANILNSRMELKDITHPYLVALSNYFEESTCVSIERDMCMVYVDVVSGPSKTLMSMQRIGNTGPMHSTGNGKLALLNYTPALLDELIEKRGLPRFTDNTITDKETLNARLDEIRSTGFAYDEEENEVGLRCIACPIYNFTGRVVAGVSVTGPASRLSQTAILEKLPFLKETAEKISAELGYKNG
jgi:DNA-binding IclR family transcriptional regulator